MKTPLTMPSMDDGLGGRELLGGWRLVDTLLISRLDGYY